MCATINQITIGSPIGNINWISPSSEPCVVCSMTSVTLCTKKITPLMYELIRNKSDNYFGTLLSISGFFSSFSFFLATGTILQGLLTRPIFLFHFKLFPHHPSSYNWIIYRGWKSGCFFGTHQTLKMTIFVFFLQPHLIRFRSTLKRKGTFSYLLDPIFMSPTTLALS